MSLVDRLRSSAQRFLQNEKVEGSPNDDVERQRERSERLFKVIQLMEQDRDRWKGMFFEQAREHVAAQAMLELAVERAGRLVERLIAALNARIVKEGQDPLDLPSFIREQDLGFSKRYAEHLRAAVERMPVDTNWRDVVRPEEFGAVADGVSNDREPIQAAVDVAEQKNKT